MISTPPGPNHPSDDSGRCVTCDDLKSNIPKGSRGGRTSSDRGGSYLLIVASESRGHEDALRQVAPQDLVLRLEIPHLESQLPVRRLGESVLNGEADDRRHLPDGNARRAAR